MSVCQAVARVTLLHYGMQRSSPWILACHSAVSCSCSSSAISSLVSFCGQGCTSCSVTSGLATASSHIRCKLPTLGCWLHLLVGDVPACDPSCYETFPAPAFLPALRGIHTCISFYYSRHCTGHATCNACYKPSSVKLIVHPATSRRHKLQHIEEHAELAPCH